MARLYRSPDDIAQHSGPIRCLGLVCASFGRGGASVRWAPVEWALWVDTAPGRGCGQSREGFKCARKRAPDYEPAQVRRAISRDDSP